MTSRTLLCLCFVCAGLYAEENSANVPRPQLTPQQLTEQLSADDFDARKRAEAALEKLGEIARPALEQAAHSDNAELKTSAEMLLRKLAAATLRLHVYDSSGKAVATEGEAIIAPSKAGEEPQTISFKSAADGICDLRLKTLGKQSLQLKFTGLIYPNDALSIEARNGVNEVLVEVQRPGTISGVVLGADGEPLKDANITLFSNVDFVPEIIQQQIDLYHGLIGLEDFRNAVSDEKGAWQSALPAGVYACVVSAVDCRSVSAGLVRVREGAEILVPSVRLAARKSGTLEMKLREPDGDALMMRTVHIELERLIDVAIADPRTARAVRNLKAGIQNGVAGLGAGAEEITVRTNAEGVAPWGHIYTGKYAVRVHLDNAGEAEPGEPYFEQELEIKSGETLTIAQSVAEATAEVSGRVLDKAGNGIGNVAVLLLREATLRRLQDGPAIHETLLAMASLHNNAGSLSTNTSNDGSFKLAAVAPGDYTALLLQDNRVGYCFGIEAAPGKQVRVPDIKWESAAESGRAQTFKGKVVNIAGRGIPNADLNVVQRGFTTVISADEDGHFLQQNFLSAQNAEGAQDLLVIRAEGFKTLLVQAPFFEREKFQLEAEHYGSLKVRVEDGAGKALPGATVHAADALAPVADEARARSDETGIARLSGLAAGRRRLDAALPGYFLAPDRALVDVRADTETIVTLVLQKGVTIRGSVRATAGGSLKGAMVHIEPSGNFVPVGTDGSFAIEGVTPGHKVLRAAGPGLVPGNFAVIDVPVKPAEILAKNFGKLELQLARPCALIFDCGRDFSNCQGVLIPDASGPEAEELTGLLANQTETVDVDGRIEFSAVPPGKYFLSLLVSNLSVSPLESSSSTVSAADPRCGPFEAQPFEGIATLSAMQALKAEFPPRAGSVKVRLNLLQRAEHIIPTDGGVYLEVKLTGPRASAEVLVDDLKRLVAGFNQPPAIMGAAPKWFHARPPNELEFTALPAGEYTLSVQESSNAPDGQEETDEFGKIVSKTSPTVVLGTFTVPDGGAIDAGEITLDSSKLGGVNASEGLRRLLAPQDRGTDFNP